MEDVAPVTSEWPIPTAFRGAYAHTVRRIVAYLMDAVILGGLIFVTVAIVSLILGPTVRFEGVDGVTALVVDSGRVLVNAILAAALNGVYFVGSWMRSGRTPGQAIVGIVVVGARDGELLGMGPATVRWLALGAAPIGILSPLVRPVPGAGLWLALVATAWITVLLLSTVGSRVNRGLHDRLAGSVVLRSRPGPDQPRATTPTTTSGNT